MAYFSKEMERLAKAGFPREQYDLARCYESGLGIKLNEKAAVKWYEKAAKQGHVEASEALADCYFNGVGVKYSGRKAIEWYEKAVELGSKRAAYSLAICYESLGMVNKENGHKLIKILSIAAEAGVKEASYKLGEIYESARFSNYPNKKEAREAFLMAKDYSDACERAERLRIAMRDMGLGRALTAEEVAGMKNMAESELRERAELGITEAEFLLAMAYEKGKFGVVSEHRAYEWYIKASLKGHAASKVALAIIHLGRNEYRASNCSQAYKYLIDARESGYDSAEVDRLISTIPTEYRK